MTSTIPSIPSFLLKKYLKLLEIHLQNAYKSRGMFSKAKKYLEESRVLEIKRDKDKLIVVWDNIEGYNKEKRVVIISFSALERRFKGQVYYHNVSCNCFGFRKYGNCCHIIATYEYLKQLCNEGQK